MVHSQSGQIISHDPMLKNPSQQQKKGLAKWFKVKVLSSSPSTTEEKKREKNHSWLKI
jgi:hypothetical protein